MRKFFAVAMGSLVALVGFAGMASASATVDLIWIDISNVNTAGAPICLRPQNRNCLPIGDGVTLSSVAVTDNITLGVIITAGPLGLLGAGVDVFYGAAIPKLSVFAFKRLTTTTPGVYLPTSLGEPNDDTEGWVQLINATAVTVTNTGIGLPAGQTAYLGTVTFHKDAVVNGTFEIQVRTDGPDGASGVLRLDGVNITDTTTYNSAFLVNVPEPGALSLLVMGLSGMLLAGRGRRS